MINHNVVEISTPMEMWEEHDGTRRYVLHGRNPSPFHRGIEIVDFAGAGIILGRYVRNLEDARQVLSTTQTQDDLISALVSARGSLSVHAFDHVTRDYLIMNDPLGGGQIYQASYAGRTVLSSDMSSLVDVYKLRGTKLKKNIIYFMTELLTYTQVHGADTPYSEIELLSRGEFVRISKDGMVTRFYATPPECFYFSGMSYNEGLHAFVDDMLENVARSSEHDFDLKISHLTAGFDSRLVLAAIMKNGIQDDFLYYCIRSSTDHAISQSLAGHLGLKHVSNNDGNPRGRGYQKNYHEYVKNGSRASQFILAEGLDFRFSPRNNLVYQGGYGELARTFNSIKWDGDASKPHVLAYNLWGKWGGFFPAEGEVHSSIWSSDYINTVIQRLSEKINRFKKLGLKDDYFTNFFYIENRNRLFIGARTYYANIYRSQLDPIYSSHLAWLPASLDFYRRQANFIGMDAMMLMQPALASLPFDGAKIKDLYRRERPEITLKPFNGQLPTQIDLPNHLSNVIEWPGEQAVVSDSASAASKALGIPEIVAHGIETMMPIMLERMWDDPEFRKVINPVNLTGIKNPLNVLTRDQARQLNRIISAFILADLI